MSTTATLERTPPQLPRIPAPPVAPRAVGLILAVAEAMVGRRPLHQVSRHLTVPAFRKLIHYAEGGELHGSALGRLRLQSPAEGTIEATLTVLVRGRWLACAVLLVHGEDWLCPELHVVGLG